MNNLMRILGLVLLMATSQTSPAIAQEQTLLPAYYSVTHVAVNDVLNVREGPGASFPVISTFQPNSRDIEVVGLSDDQKWALVAMPENHGWVSLRFLNRQAGQNSTDLPRPISCFGTEPFWNLQLDKAGAKFGQFGTEQQSLETKWHDKAAGMGPYTYGALLQGRDVEIHAVIERTICSDGMSDRLYGLSISAFYTGVLETELYTGCCVLQ